MRATARRLLYAVSIAAVLAGCATSVASGGDPMAASVVRVDLFDGGHGSGVNIGGGIVLTAGHVGKGQKSVAIKDSNGIVHAADVLWVNEAYDVAALKYDGTDIESAHLSCRTTSIGEQVVAAGSPGQEDNIYIPGVIVSNERASGPWTVVVVASLAATGGISGGPVYAADGDVIGLVVGGQIGYVPRENNEYNLSQTGLAYVVPASAICGLLGREVM